MLVAKRGNQTTAVLKHLSEDAPGVSWAPPAKVRRDPSHQRLTGRYKTPAGASAGPMGAIQHEKKVGQPWLFPSLPAPHITHSLKLWASATGHFLISRKHQASLPTAPPPALCLANFCLPFRPWLKYHFLRETVPEPQTKCGNPCLLLSLCIWALSSLAQWHLLKTFV